MINYFDVGSNIGITIKMMFGIFGELGIKDFRIFGFEPTEATFQHCIKQFGPEKRIKMNQCAVGPSPVKMKLYHTNGIGDGNSLFRTKNNVNWNDYEEVQVIKFSNFIKEKVSKYKKEFNILQANIEGSEWYLFHDIVKTGVYKYIDIFLGEGCPYPIDLLKVSELGTAKYNQLGLLMENNGIVMHRFAAYRPELNENIGKFIRELLEKGKRV